MEHKCRVKGCKHERIRYCVKCGKPYCENCGKEWEDTYPLPTYLTSYTEPTIAEPYCTSTVRRS